MIGHVPGISPDLPCDLTLGHLSECQVSESKLHNSNFCWFLPRYLPTWGCIKIEVPLNGFGFSLGFPVTKASNIQLQQIVEQGCSFHRFPPVFPGPSAPNEALLLPFLSVLVGWDEANSVRLEALLDGLTEALPKGLTLGRPGGGGGDGLLGAF